VRYFITSLALDEAGPERIAAHVRGHWNIENGSHWQRDNLWREDGHLMRQHCGAHILSSLRQVALCQHSTRKPPRPDVCRISHRTQYAAYNLTHAISMLRHPP